MPTEMLSEHLSDQPFKVLDALMNATAETSISKDSKNPRTQSPEKASSVETPHIDSKELLERLQRELAQDSSLAEDVRSLRVVLEHGSAKIIGAVRTAKGKFRISQLARMIAGSRRVTNDLQVVTI